MNAMSNFTIGIDEVGRGPVAGPVYVCAAKMNSDFYADFKNPEKRIELMQKIIDDHNLNIKKIPPLRDSKKLSKKYKEAWVEIFKKMRDLNLLSYSISSASNLDIDNVGISACIKKCLNSNLKKLEANSTDQIKLDGSLFAPPEYLNQETIVKGDDLEPIISVASIIAKVARDEYMTTLGADFPNYSFEKNMGYGTAVHMSAIKKHGITKFHRVSFLRN